MKITRSYTLLPTLLAILLTAASIGATAAADTTPALDATWKFKHGDNPFHTPPIIQNDLVISLPKNDDIIVLTLNGGKQLWRHHHPAGFWERSVSTDKNHVYVGTTDRKLCAIWLNNGEKHWCQQLPKNMQKAALVYEDKLYVVTAELGPGLDGDREQGGSIYAIDTNTGEIHWEVKTDNYAMQRPFANGSSLYIAGSYYDPSIDVDEGGPLSILALDLNNGTEKWRYQSEDGFVKALYATDQHIAFVGYQDFINALDTTTGELVWRRDTGNWVPAISGYKQSLYYGSANTKVHAWQISDGNTIWEYNIPEGSFNYVLDAPIRIGQQLFFISQQGELFALNAINGKPIMHYKTDIIAHVGLATNGNWVVVGDASGTIHAYKIKPKH